MKTCVIDVGGGLRGIYAAGVLDRCLDDGVTFDVGIGVSAGSANIASFIAGQKRRNHAFYTEYSQRDEYMSRNNIRTKGCYLDVAYIYGSLSNSDGENPLDYRAFMNNRTEFIAVATEAETGHARYFGKQDMPRDRYEVLMASCAIPHVCLPQSVDGTLYYDGALSDPIPLDKALALGCDKIVLLLTQPVDMPYPASEDAALVRRIRKQYPAAAEALTARAEKYDREILRAAELEACDIVRIVAPDDTCGVDTLTRDKEALERLYQKGYRDGARISDYIMGETAH